MLADDYFALARSADLKPDNNVIIYDTKGGIKRNKLKYGKIDSIGPSKEFNECFPDSIKTGDIFSMLPNGDEEYLCWKGDSGRFINIYSPADETIYISGMVSGGCAEKTIAVGPDTIRSAMYPVLSSKGATKYLN